MEEQCDLMEEQCDLQCERYKKHNPSIGRAENSYDVIFYMSEYTKYRTENPIAIGYIAR